jgi:hypothetical protein
VCAEIESDREAAGGSGWDGSNLPAADVRALLGSNCGDYMLAVVVLARRWALAR